MAKGWFIKNGDRISGPFSIAHLTRLVKVGRLAASDLLSKDNPDGPWRHADESSALFPDGDLFSSEVSPQRKRSPAFAQQPAETSSGSGVKVAILSIVGTLLTVGLGIGVYFVAAGGSGPAGDKQSLSDNTKPESANGQPESNAVDRPKLSKAEEASAKLERLKSELEKRVVYQERQLDTREQELKIADSQVTDLKARLSEKERELAAAESRLQVANARISAANRKPRSPQPTARQAIVSKKTAVVKATRPSSAQGQRAERLRQARKEYDASKSDAAGNRYRAFQEKFAFSGQAGRKLLLPIHLGSLGMHSLNEAFPDKFEPSDIRKLLRKTKVSHIKSFLKNYGDWAITPPYTCNWLWKEAQARFRE